MHWSGASSFATIGRDRFTLILRGPSIWACYPTQTSRARIELHQIGPTTWRHCPLGSERVLSRNKLRLNSLFEGIGALSTTTAKSNYLLGSGLTCCVFLPRRTPALGCDVLAARNRSNRVSSTRSRPCAGRALVRWASSLNGVRAADDQPRMVTTSFEWPPRSMIAQRPVAIWSGTGRRVRFVNRSPDTSASLACSLSHQQDIHRTMMPIFTTRATSWRGDVAPGGAGAKPMAMWRSRSRLA